jgi:hypothetical protein
MRLAWVRCLSAFILLGSALPAPAGASAGYSLYRVVIWGQPGELPPQLRQDPESGRFRLLFPGPAPESGWDPVPARCLELHGGAFVPAEPVPILRPRDPNPDWDSTALEGSLDINRDGLAEVVRARTVLVPDSLDPAASRQRVLVTLSEGERILFSDLIKGPASSSARVHSLFSTDFTGEGFPDIVVFLEAEDRTGAAFYSQRELRYAGEGSRRVDGTSEDFRCDAYGIFDLNRKARDFFSHLPASARPAVPGCPDTRGTEGDGLAHCLFRFNAPYLGWIGEFRVGFLPSRGIKSFDFFFPGKGHYMTPDQALAFLTPVFGGNFRAATTTRFDGAKELTWQWSGKKAVATLRGEEVLGERRATSLKLERP